MSLGVAIGRVAIKILPDTSEFREQVVADLKKVESSLGHVEVDVLLNVTEKSKKAAKKEIEAWARSISPVEVNVKAELDKKSLKQAKDAIDDATEEIKKVKVAVDKDSLSSVRSAIQKIEGELDRLKLVEIEVDLDKNSLNEMLTELKDLEAELPLELEIDKSDLASVKAALAAVTKELSKHAAVKMSVDLDEDSLRAAQAELRGIVDDFDAVERAMKDAEKAAKAQAKETDAAAKSMRRLGKAGGNAVAGLSGLRYTLGLFRRLRDEMLNLDLAVPKIGAVSHAIAVLGAWVLGVAGNLFSLSSSLATMGKAGLALPGMLAGIGIGLGVMVAALVDFNKEVPKASEYLKKLQDIISKNFWEEAAKPIRELVDKLFPLLSQKLGEVATQAGVFFAAFANSTTSILLPQLAPMFDNLSESIKIASTYTDAFVGIITKLGLVGSAYLPNLATWFGDIATQFDNWLGEVGTDGLAAMIDEGIVAMQNFGSVIASTFSIFASLGRAAEAAGGATLESLATNLRGVAAAAKDPAFQTGLTNTLRASYEMLDQIKSIAGPAIKELIKAMSTNFQEISPVIGDTVGTAVKTFAEIFSNPAVGKGMEAMSKGFNDLVKAIAPHADLIAGKFGSVFTLIGALASSIGAVLGPVVESLGPIFSNTVDALVPIVKMLGPMIGDTIEQLAPVFKVMGENVTKVIGKLKPLFKAIKELIDLMLPVLVPVLKIVANIIGDALVGVIDGVIWLFKGMAKIIGGVIDVFKGLWDVIAGIFTLDFGRILDGLGGIFSGLGSILLGALQAALGAVWAYLNGTVLSFFRGFGLKLLGPLKGPFSKVFEPIEKGVIKVMDFLGKILVKFAQPFIKAFNWIKDIVGRALEAIKTFIFDGVMGWYNIFKGAWAFVGETFALALAYLKSLVSGAINWIKTFITNGVTAWVNIFKTVWTEIKLFFQGALDGLKWAFQTKFDDIANYIDLRFNAIYSFFKNIWGKIKTEVMEKVDGLKSSLSDAWNKVNDTVRDAWTKVKERVISGVSDAIDKVKEMPDKAKKALAGIATVLVNAGKDLIEGFIDGIKDKFEKVKSTLGDLTNKLTSWKGPPAKDKTLLTGAGHLIMDSLIKGFEDRFKAVRDVLGRLTTDIAGFIGSSMSSEISDALSVASSSTISARMSASVPSTEAEIGHRLAGLDRQISSAARDVSGSSTESTPSSISIGNITIPLEHLEQLKSLEDFLEMLRVRARQG